VPLNLFQATRKHGSVKISYVHACCCLILWLFILCSILPVAVANPTPQKDNLVKVTTIIEAPDQYKLYGTVNSAVSVNVELWVVSTISRPITVSLPISDGTILNAKTSLPSNAKYTLEYRPSAAALIMNITLPSNTKYASITLSYILPVTSVLYQNNIIIPSMQDFPANYVAVEGLPSYIIEKELIVKIPQHSLLLYSYQTPSSVLKNEVKYLAPWTEDLAHFVLVYEAPLSIIVKLLTAVFLVFSGFKSKLITKKMRGVNLFTTGLRFFRRNVVRIDSKVIFASFLCTMILMLVMASVIGPYPKPTVLVVAEPNESSQLVSWFQQYYPQLAVYPVETWKVQPGIMYLRPDLVVVGTYAITGVTTTLDYIRFESIDNTDFIIELCRRGTYIFILDDAVNTPLARAIAIRYERYYPNVLGRLFIGSLGELNSAVSLAVNKRENIPRFYHWSYEVYRVGVSILAVLSLAALYLGGLTVSSLIPSLKFKSLIFNVGATLFLILLIFPCIVLVYMLTSYIICLPLSVHAIASQPASTPLTAIGYLGFGGGNIPRLIVAFLGIITGILLNHFKRIQEIDFKLIFWVVNIALVLFLLPVPLIQYALVTVILTFIQGEALPEATLGRTLSIIFTSYILHPIIQGVSMFWSPTGQEFGVNRGIVMLYVGGMAFLATKYLGKRSRSILIMFILLFLARGFMRVGDMHLFSFIGSTPPSIILGILTFLLLIFAANIFNRIQGRIGIRR